VKTFWPLIFLAKEDNTYDGRGYIGENFWPLAATQPILFNEKTRTIELMPLRQAKTRWSL
jgi:hypothetical protein